MKVFNTPQIEKAYKKYTDAIGPLQNWYQEVEEADWDTPAKLKERYPNASIIRGDLVVFNIKGNRYRLVARINFRRRLVFVKFFGTHREYDRINVEEVQFNPIGGLFPQGNDH